MPVETAERTALDMVNEACRTILSEKEDFAVNNGHENSDPAARLRELRMEQERIENAVTGEYEAFKAGTLSRNEYRERRERDRMRITELEDEIQSLLNRSSIPDLDKQETELRSCCELTAFDPDILEKVVSRILIYDDKRLEVVFAADDFYQQAAGLRLRS